LALVPANTLNFQGTPATYRMVFDTVEHRHMGALGATG
jgi:hypothetical protein